MKSVTADMLRAHLVAASLTAMGIEAIALLTLLMFPIDHAMFDSMPFRVLAAVAIVVGVVVQRWFAHLAFELALRNRQVTYRRDASGTVSIPEDCPRRMFVILHMRLSGKPFELAQH